MALTWGISCGYSPVVAGAGVIWKASSLRFLPGDACCQLKPQLGLSSMCLHDAALWGPSFLIVWHLGSKSKAPKGSRQPRQRPLWFSLGSHKQHHFCHSLFIRSKSLGPAHIQGEGNQTPPLKGKSIRNLANMIPNHYSYLAEEDRKSCSDLINRVLRD